MIVTMIMACDTTIDPLDEDTGIYAIYGVLDLNRETNYIRVRDLNAPFTEEATQEIDAVVTLENLDTGLSHVLESSRQEKEGVYLHNFVAIGDISPDTDYRITAERSDGATVSVTTTTPTMPDPNVSPSKRNCYTPIKVEFNPTNGGTIQYNIGFIPADTSWGGVTTLKGDGNGPGSLSFTFRPVDRITRSVGSANRRCHDLRSEDFIIFVRHYAPGLYEKIENDPFDILQSTERFGAFYTDSFEIPIDTSRVCPPDCL